LEGRLSSGKIVRLLIGRNRHGARFFLLRVRVEQILDKLAGRAGEAIAEIFDGTLPREPPLGGKLSPGKLDRTLLTGQSGVEPKWKCPVSPS
jgi:hypothetical protein